MDYENSQFKKLQDQTLNQMRILRRKLKLLELLKTQLNYHKKLELLINHYILKMKDHIPEQELNVLFPNIPAIEKISNQLIRMLKEQISSWDCQNTCLTPIAVHLSTYLILYSQYYLNKNQMNEIIQPIRKMNIVKQIEKQTNSYLNNLLDQPMYRVSKYSLLFTDYIGLLSKNHKDYESLQKKINQLNRTMNKNNNILRTEQNQKHITELRKFHPNICEGRMLQWRQTHQAETQQEKCKIQVFSDLLFIISPQNNVVINIDANSFVIRQFNGFKYTNKLFISGKDNTVHLVFPSTQKLDALCTTVQQLIEQSKKVQIDRQSELKKRISFRASCKISYKDYFFPTNDLKKNIIQVIGYTVKNYIHECGYFIIKIYSLVQDIYETVYLKQSQLYQIQQLLRSIYPKELPQNNFFQNCEFLLDQNQIEDKFFHIERFLNQIVRNKTIEHRLQTLFYLFKISEGFWNIISQSKSCPCTCKNCQEPVNITKVQQYYALKKSRLEKLKSEKIKLCPFFSIHCQKSLAKINPKQSSQQFETIEQRLDWINCKKNKIQHQLMNRMNLRNTYKFKVKLIQQEGQKQLEVKINDYDLIQYVLRCVCQQLKISIKADLGLCTIINGYYQILDPEERAVDIFLELEKKQRKSYFSFWGNVQQSVYLKKIYTFDMFCEIKSCKNNPERYKLLIQEFMYRLKSSQIILDEDFLIEICANYYQLSHSYSSQEVSILIVTKQLQKILPLSYMKNKKFIANVETKINLNRQEKIYSNQQIYSTIFQNFYLSNWLAVSTLFFKINKCVCAGKQNINKLKIGVNYQKIIIAIEKFKLTLFEYVSVGDNLKITANKETYELNINDNYTLVSQIQQYRSYHEYFLSNN